MCPKVIPLPKIKLQRGSTPTHSQLHSPPYPIITLPKMSSQRVLQRRLSPFFRTVKKMKQVSVDIEEIDFSNFGGFVTQPQPFTEIEYTNIHHEAVRVIQRTVRRVILNQSGSARSTLESRRTETYQQYLQASKYMVWRSRKYKHVFLGALPHLLLCTREVRMYVRGQKAELKSVLKKGFGSDETSLPLSEMA